MKRFKSEEIIERGKLVHLCHDFIRLFNAKKETLIENWTKRFEEGQIDQVTELFNKTVKIVDLQINKLELIIKFLNENKGNPNDHHMNYENLVLQHFQSGEKYYGALELLDFIHKDLLEQKKILESKKKQGPGQQAYSENFLQNLTRKEFTLLEEVKPFWHDWEVVGAEIEKLTKNLEQVDEDEIHKIRDKIELQLQQHHSDYADNNKAAQLGTELAVNLVFNPTERIDNHKFGNRQGNVPIALINIDMTSCNSTDGSHKLGDAMIEEVYRELNRQLVVKFKKIQKPYNYLNPEGAITISGRTRFKLVGIYKEEIEKALGKVSKKVLETIRKQFEGKFEGIAAENFKRLNTRMVVGYTELETKGIRKEIEYQRTMSIQRHIGGVRDPQQLTFGGTELKKIEEIVAKNVTNALIQSAAKAEYLEKEIIKKRDAEFNEICTKEGIPNEIYWGELTQQQQRIMTKLFEKYPDILIYDKEVEKQWIGRNFIPEEEFGMGMVQRLSHNMGLRKGLTNELFELLHNYNKRKLSVEEIARLREVKLHFLENVMHLSHLQSVYDIRYPKALKEEFYDETIYKMSILEGNQIITFMEIDGFNAYNTMYIADGQDTYYHMMLDWVYTCFNGVINQGIPKESQRELRMTKQGDEIWFSYPRHHLGNDITEKKHKLFLERISEGFISRDLEKSIMVPNIGTVDWCPYLILHDHEMKSYIKHALNERQQLLYVDNAQFREQPKNPMIQDIIINNPEQKFWKGLFYMIESANKNIHDFSKWKIIDNCIDVRNQKDFLYSQMLFKETVKAHIAGSWKRVYSGRIKRVGTTILYCGFKQNILLNSIDEVKAFRKELNERVEDLRDKYGRGGIYQYEKYFSKNGFFKKR